MNKYQVAIYRPVADLTVCYVNVEAATEEDACAAALAMDHSDLEFDWFCCTDSLEAVTAEVKHKINPDV